MAVDPTGNAEQPLQQAWGRVLNPEGSPQLFKDDGAPSRHVRGVHPPAGTDHMRLQTVDVFRIPGMGEYEVPFAGYFKVQRGDPDSHVFNEATVYVNFLDLKLFGEHAELGEITVDLNPTIRSAGNTFPGRDGNEACAINVAARFHVDRLGITLFNKTPIQLKNPNVQGIPTIGEGGQAYVNSLPLYKWDDQNGELFGYVEELRYLVLDYATKEEQRSYLEAKNLSELRSLAQQRDIRIE